jgi:hypothetical protein
MKYDIDVPIPAKSRKTSAIGSALDEMPVGASGFFPKGERQSTRELQLLVNGHVQNRRRAGKGKYTIRIVAHEGELGVRVWRMA